MKLHSKKIGMIGHLAVAQHLITLGYAVFTELGDSSRIDLLVEKDKKVYKIQVKTCNTDKKGSIVLKASKSGPNYSYRYEIDDVDVFAVYSVELGMCCFINALKFLKHNNTFTIRIKKSENNQKKRINHFSDFLNFEEALRDYTLYTQTDVSAGDELVQTTTEETSG